MDSTRRKCCGRILFKFRSSQSRRRSSSFAQTYSNQTAIIPIAKRDTRSCMDWYFGMMKLLVSSLFFVSTSCSAPEVLPPTRKRSPAEIAGRTNAQPNSPAVDLSSDVVSKSQEKKSTSKEIPVFKSLVSEDNSNELQVGNPKAELKNDQQTIHSDAVQGEEIISQSVETPKTEEGTTSEEEIKIPMDEELKISMLQPPFTSWTNQPTSILNPQGKVVFDIVRTAVRLEVQKISYGYAQVICSGCSGPTHNHAGWISIDYLSTYNAYGSQQMKDFLQWRDSLTTKESVGGMEAIHFCKLIDAGFEVRGTSLSFSQFSISSNFSMSSLKMQSNASEVQGGGDVVLRNQK